METPHNIDDTIQARKIARRMVQEKMADDALTARLLDLEQLAAPFYLGIDTDECGDDVDIYP